MCRAPLNGLHSAASTALVGGFAPNGGDEDPVTGSIHAALAPFWSERLGKPELVAMQVSRRTGLLHCRVQDDRVYISGQAVQYLEGTIEVPEA
jgi:predicted PhzF superfamily epimerase YddE/YHI9